MARITKTFIKSTFDTAARKVTKGCQYLDGLMTDKQLRFSVFVPSESAAQAGAASMATDLIASRFPLNTVIRPWPVTTGQSAGKWKIEAYISLAHKNPTISVQLR